MKVLVLTALQTSPSIADEPRQRNLAQTLPKNSDHLDLALKLQVSSE
jgi:hypothetical protein